MRNIVILNSLHFSYPLPILMRVSYNTLIVKQNTSDYYKYTNKTAKNQYFSDNIYHLSIYSVAYMVTFVVFSSVSCSFSLFIARLYSFVTSLI